MVQFASFRMFLFLLLWECEKLHQLRASEAINSTEDLKGRGAGGELTRGHLFIAVTHIKPDALCECWVRNCDVGLMLMCEDDFSTWGRILTLR